MQKTCNNCGTEKYGNSQVVFTEYAYEAHEARHEREKKRLWIVILVLIAALIATNIAWIIYECSFEEVITTTEEYYDVEQDADGGGNNNSIINGGVINGEAEDTVHKESNHKDP